MMDELSRADEEVREIVPAIVSRHRSVGILTWALLHEIESEVLALLTAEGNYSKHVLNMMRAPKVMGYPTDNREVSFKGHGAVSLIFSAIEKAWNKVH